MSYNQPAGNASPEAFSKAFHLDDGIPKGFITLFLSLNHTGSGEATESFGLFACGGMLYEVVGSECSMWDFNGQWDPEPTTLDALRHRIRDGRLGTDGDGNDRFASDLGHALDEIEGRLSATRAFNAGDRLRLAHQVHDLGGKAGYRPMTVDLGPVGAVDEPSIAGGKHLDFGSLFAAVFAAREVPADQLLPCKDDQDDRLRPGRRFFMFEVEGIDFFVAVDGSKSKVGVYAGGTGLRESLYERLLVVRSVGDRLMADIRDCLAAGEDLVEPLASHLVDSQTAQRKFSQRP